MAASAVVGSVSGTSSSNTTTLQTPNQSVSTGSTIYVHVAQYGGSSLGTPSIADSQTGNYGTPIQTGSKQIGTTGNYVYLWVFRRSAPVLGDPSFWVKASSIAANSPIELVAIEVKFDGGKDASSLSSGVGTGNQTIESNSVTTSGTNELVLFLVADNSPTPVVQLLAGEFPIPNYPAAITNIRASGTYQEQSSAGSANSQVTFQTTGNYTWVAASVAIFPAANPWTQIAGKSVLTVSPIGLNSGSTIANNGADFGPDTPSTSTNGIQEALSAASALGVSRVLLLPGIFNLNTNVVWPIGWSGILEGSGSALQGGGESTATVVQTSGSFSSSTLDMLDLGTQDVIGITIRDIYFFYGLSSGPTSGGAVVNLSQLTDKRHSVRIERCDFDSGSCNSSGFVSLIMDFNQGSVLEQVNCWSPLVNGKNQFGLRWHSPGGGAKVFGGTYDGMDLKVQVAGLFGVTTNHKIEVTGLANTGKSPIIHLFDHYRNPDAGSGTATVLNSSGGAVIVIVVGGWLYGTGTSVFFDSSGTGSSLVLTIGGTMLVADAHAGPNPLISSSTSNKLYIISPLGTANSVQINTAQESSGVGVPMILGLDSRPGLTTQDANPLTLATSPGNNSQATTPLTQVRLSLSVTAIAVNAGQNLAFTYTVTWIDENGNSQSASVSASAVTPGVPPNTFANTVIGSVKPSTTISVQLKSLSGTGAKVDVAAIAEAIL